MRSIVVKNGSVEVEKERVSISDNNIYPQANPQRGGGSRVFNAIPSKKKVHDHEEEIVKPIAIHEELPSDVETKPYVFPTLDEKEIEYATEGESVTENEIIIDDAQPAFTEPFDAAPHRDNTEPKSLYDDMVSKSIAEASRILEDAHAKAQIDYHQLVESGKNEIEIAKGEAYKQGIAEGTRSQVANVRACIEQLEHAVARIEGKQEEYFATCDQDLKWLALEIVQKVLIEKVTADELALYPLVSAAVAKQKNADWLTVEISDDAPQLIQALKAELEKGDERTKITINPVQAPTGTCRIQTAEGFIDASIYRQLDNLREYFSQQPQ